MNLATLKEHLPLILSLWVNVMFFVVLCSLLLRELPNSTRDVLLILIGALVAGWKDALGYSINSTASSAAKTQLIKDVIDKGNSHGGSK